MAGPFVCLEILLVTICAWIGASGMVDEAVRTVEDRRVRVLAYAILLLLAFALAAFQQNVTVCGLLAQIP